VGLRGGGWWFFLVLTGLGLALGRALISANRMIVPEERAVGALAC
jgi:hypothetical protein